MTVPHNKFAQIDEAAHSGAFGFNPFVLPTDKQMKAGNYKKGKFSLHGLKIAIEQPRDSYRTGTDKSGNRWSCRLAANYGYILKTTGNDGDHVDCFIGSYPESETVYVVNQYVNGVFDEHKVMLCYPAESFARSDYQFSYSRDWNGLHSIVSMSIKQFKQWLKHGDMTMPVTAADNLPITEVSQMQRTQWDDNGNPIGKSIGKLMYELRGLDDDGLLLDSISDDDFYHEWGDSLTGSEEGIFDSLNVPYARMRMTTNLIKREFNKVAGTLKVAEPAEGETPNPYISEKPFTKDGMSMVMVKYRLTDEQTITIMFFNPDLTPSKVTKTDIMVAFKWMLNKKDLTVLVSPEFGQDVKLNVVAARIMGLANKNMDAFARANKSNADNIKAIADLNAEISTLEAELEQAKAANLVAQSNADNAEIEAVTNPANVSSAFIPTHTYYDPDDGTVELMRNSDGNWQSADGTEYLDIDDEVVAIGGVAVVPQPDKPMTDLFKSGLLKALKQKTANTDGSTPSIDDFSLRVGKLILEKNISPEMLAELSGASADKAIDAIYPMIWSNTQPTKTIDPVTLANINASGISAAIKKKAIAYLSANPNTHSFEGSGLSNVSQNAIMESVNNALYSEVKNILPDTEVGAFSTSTEKTEGKWTAKLIKKSVSKDGAIDVVLIGVENYKGNYKFFAKAQERIGTSITKDDNLFDSTQTLEDLRSWGFALPFDLDVKAFVANVIKPVVDEFLSKQSNTQPPLVADIPDNIAGIKIGDRIHHKDTSIPDATVTKIKRNTYPLGFAGGDFIVVYKTDDTNATGGNTVKSIWSKVFEQAVRLGAIKKIDTNATQSTQTIDPVALANINASGVSAAIKKKAIAYLSANPTSHTIEGINPKSLKAIMESIKAALFAEIKALSPLFQEQATLAGTGMVIAFDNNSWLQIEVQNRNGNKVTFSTMDAKDENDLENSSIDDIKNLFDSTQTLEDLRSWGFALPFDLDVKAFVANVIKPVVDKFLSKQAAVVPSKASKPSTPNLNQSDKEIKKAAIIDWHRDTDLMLLVGDYFGIDSELDEAYVYARLTKSKNITPEELSEAYELVAFVESDEDVPYEFYSKFEDTDPESVDIGSYKEGEIPFSMLTKKTRTAWIIEKIIKQHDGVVSWGDFNGSVSGSIFDSVLNGVVGQFGTKTGGLVGYIEINDNGEAVISINSKGIAMRPPTNNLTDKIQNLKKQIDGAFRMFTETKIVEGDFPIWKPKPTVTVTPAVTPKPQTPEVDPPTNSFDADIEALRELVGSEEFKPLVNSLLDALEDAGNESYDDVIGEIINQHAAAKVAAAKRV